MWQFIFWYSLVERPNTFPLINSCNLRYHKQEEGKSNYFQIISINVLATRDRKTSSNSTILLRISETFLRFHHKWNGARLLSQVASLIAKQLNTWELRTWGNFKKNLKIMCRYSPFLRFVSAIFYQIFIFRQMIALQKLWKVFFISYKKLFSFLRYSDFYIFAPPSLFSCQPLL